MRHRTTISLGLSALLLAGWIATRPHPPEAPVTGPRPALSRTTDPMAGWGSQDPRSASHPSDLPTFLEPRKTGDPKVDATRQVLGDLSLQQRAVFKTAGMALAPLSRVGPSAPERRYTAVAVGALSRLRDDLEVNAAGAEDVQPLLQDIDSALGDLRATTQEEYGQDRFSDDAERQRRVLAAIRQSPYADDGTLRMVTMLEHRLSTYDREVAGSQAGLRPIGTGLLSPQLGQMLASSRPTPPQAP